MSMIIDPTEYFQFGVEVCRNFFPVNSETKLSQQTILSRRFDIAKNEMETIVNYIDNGTPQAIQYTVEPIIMRVIDWKGGRVAVGYSCLTNTVYLSKFFNQWSVE